MGGDDDLAGEPVDSPRREDKDFYTELGRFTVDGETFLVRRRDVDGSHHYDWISGPNDRYGFSVSGGSEPLSREWHENEIRGFLRAIDPTTGYL